LTRFGFRQSSRRAAAIGCAAFLVLWGFAGWQPVSAATGPFADFRGNWSGSGTIRQQGSPTERVRCDANYRPIGSTQHQIILQLRCKSDSYNFDLTGQFQADSGNQITGNWTERTRGIGGTVVGNARGNRIQIHVESGGFSATMYLVTRSRHQSVTIDSHGGGQVVKASISLRRR
jgi:hypothetical protein